MAGRPFTILRLVCILLMCAAGTGLRAQDDEGVPEYKFNTSLSHGYSLVYRTDDSLQYLYLHKGKMLKQISWEYKENKQSLLGYIAYDFDKYFVLLRTLHVLGNDIPMDFKLFDKKTAKVILEGYYIDALDSVVLYHDQHNMKLYNVNTGKTTVFNFPKLADWRRDKLINMIRLKTVAPHEIVIEYNDDIDNEKRIIKKYKK